MLKYIGIVAIVIAVEVLIVLVLDECGMPIGLSWGMAGWMACLVYHILAKPQYQCGSHCEHQS